MMILEWLKAVLYGILEGVTEWLPISSTGHLILLGEWLPFAFSNDPAMLAAFSELFSVVIQLGAVLAVPVLFWDRLCPGVRQHTEDKRQILALWGRVALACVPAALVGTFGDALLEMRTGRDLDGWLYRPTVVALMLVAYGLAFIWVERRNRCRSPKIGDVSAISLPKSFCIGCFQALSMVPGTSRSGATILGGLLLGIDRVPAAEFSFFMAIPTMLGAGAVKAFGFISYVREQQITVPWMAWVLLLLGTAVSFLVSLTVIRFLMGFVKKHSLTAFGVYRILLGIAVLLVGLLRG